MTHILPFFRQKTKVAASYRWLFPSPPRLARDRKKRGQHIIIPPIPSTDETADQIDISSLFFDTHRSANNFPTSPLNDSSSPHVESAPCSRRTGTLVKITYRGRVNNIVRVLFISTKTQQTAVP